MIKIESLFATIIFLSIVTPAMAMPPIPEKLKSTVAFIYLEKEGVLIPNGTGFFVCVQDWEQSSTASAYIVTAKHVLQDEKTKLFFPKVFFRLNLKEGKTIPIPLTLSEDGSQKNVYLHEDPTVDLAVIPGLPAPIEKYDLEVLPVETFIPTKEEFDELIGKSQEIYFIGLLPSHVGKNRNDPIVKFGRTVAASCKIRNKEGLDALLFLAKCPSDPGNSGSPVFFYFGLGGKRSRESVKLAGVMKSCVVKDVPLNLPEIKEDDTEKLPHSHLNTGISVIVPAYQICEILYGKELRDKRNAKAGKLDSKSEDSN